MQAPSTSKRRVVEAIRQKSTIMRFCGLTIEEDLGASSYYSYGVRFYARTVQKDFSTAGSAKVGLRAERASVVRVRHLVLKKVKPEKAVTLQKNAVKWRRNGTAASSFVV